MTDRLVFHRIVITDRTISEVDGLPLVTIPREKVTCIRLVFGQIAERAPLLIVTGIVLVGIGIAGVALLVDGRLPKTGMLSAMMLVLGPMLVISALRQGPVLHVHTEGGIRKLGFGKAAKIDELPQFIEQAKQVGCVIESAIDVRR